MLPDVSDEIMYSSYDEKLSTPCSSTRTSTDTTPVDIQTSWWQTYTTSMILRTKESANFLDLLNRQGRYLRSNSSLCQDYDQESLIRSLKIQQGLIKAHFYRISSVIQDIFPGDCPTWDKIVEITENKPITSCKCQSYLRRISALEKILFEAENDLKYHNSEIVNCISALLTEINPSETDITGIHNVVSLLKAELDLKSESELSLRNKCTALEGKVELLEAQNSYKRTISQDFETEKARLESFISQLQQSEFDLKSNLEAISDDYLQLHNDYQQLSEFHRSSQDVAVNLELQLTELQNEYDAIRAELDNRSVECRGYAAQLECKESEVKSLETQLDNIRSELVTKSAIVITQLRELDRTKDELKQQKQSEVDQRLQLLILETEATKRTVVDAEKIDERTKEVMFLKTALSEVSSRPDEEKSSPAQCLTLSDSKFELSVADIQRSCFEQAKYDYGQQSAMGSRGGDEIFPSSSNFVGSALVSSVTSNDQETSAIDETMPRLVLEFDSSQEEPPFDSDSVSIKDFLREREHSIASDEKRQGKEPSPIVSCPHTSSISSFSELETSIINDLHKLRALVAPQKGMDAFVDVETDEWSDGMAVIGALVSSLVSSVTQSDAALVVPNVKSLATVSADIYEVESFHNLKNSNPADPIQHHSIQPSVETDLTYNELLSELIQAKIKLASTTDDLLRARGKRKKIPVS